MRQCQNLVTSVKALAYKERMFVEVNFDGLVGPTHNYAGLSEGNLASMHHGKTTSNPREAALQGLRKMRLLHDLGLKQAILPPQERPSLPHLRDLGFSGSDSQVLESAFATAPWLLASCSSASCMWTANAATVTCALDSQDGKTHFTAANLVSKLHRSIETQATSHALRTLFHGDRFAHHAPLAACEVMGDEGAANHTRLAPSHGEKGLNLFVYGKTQKLQRTSRFRARQSREASESIARQHGIPAAQAVFAEQSARAIDAGVFHNDVISVGNADLYFFHEACFQDETLALKEIRAKWEKLTNHPLRLLRVTEADVPLADAVTSYLFNSQLVCLPSGKTALIAPGECETTPSVARYLKEKVTGFIDEVHYPELRQSMQNGGGPACLRLRVPLAHKDLAEVGQGVFVDDSKLAKLEAWVQKHYRDRLGVQELADPQLLTESRSALDELTRLLGLGDDFYPFQRG